MFSERHLCRLLCFGGSQFLTGAGVCVWAVFVPCWFRCLGLGGFLCLTCASFCAWKDLFVLIVKVSRPEKLLCRFLVLRGFMFLTISDVWAVSCFLLLQVSVLASFSVPHLGRCLCLGGFLFLTNSDV